MFYLKSTRDDIRKQFKNAVVKCHQLEEKPKVSVVVPGAIYRVFGNKNLYTLNFRRNERAIDCNCKAGENGQVCYHAAAAFAVHIAIVSQKQAA